MTITREQVADLQPGDVVEIVAAHWPPGSSWRGPIYASFGDLRVAGGLVRFEDGQPLRGDEWTLTVVSRAPRPLYVNHPRTAPWPGDVVRDAEKAGPSVWMADRNGGWWLASMGTVRLKERRDLPERLRLLVDGETGQVVQ